MSDTDLTAVALVRYADSCPPNLHPDCPFARSTDSGNACEEQCRDLIVQLQRPGYSPADPVSAELYDAGQIALLESERRPTSEWHTASLMRLMKVAVTHPPRVRNQFLLLRHIDATNALAYLGQRGFEFEQLVREGLASPLANSLIFWVSQESSRAKGATEDDSTGGWLGVLRDHLPDGLIPRSLGETIAAALQSGFLDYVKTWVTTAPFEDVIEWRPAPVIATDSHENDGIAQWLLDRFTETYLRDWALDSLQHEYRYGRGEMTANPAAELRQRTIARASVAAEIADRVVDGRTSNLDEVKRQAIGMLRSGRRTEAAALFDAARIMDPNSWEAHNNFAFCLSIDDPGTALVALRRAEVLEPTPFPINRINQAVALRQLGRLEEALAAVELAYGQRGYLTKTAFLFSNVDDPDKAEPGYVGSYDYLIELGEKIANDLGDPAAQNRWHERRTGTDGGTTA